MSNCIIIPAYNGLKESFSHCIKSWEIYANKYNIDIYVPDSTIPDSPKGSNWELGAWEKWNGVNNIINKYDNFLMVDADTMVRWDCPDIFKIINLNGFNAVLDGKAGFAHFPQWGNLDDFTPNLDYYFNTGFQVFSQEIGKNIIKNLPVYFDFWVNRHLNNIKIDAVEQTAVNLIIQKLKIPLNILPIKFNNLVLHNYHDFSFINDNYVWHFTGPNMGGWANKENIINQIWEDVIDHYLTPP